MTPTCTNFNDVQFAGRMNSSSRRSLSDTVKVLLSRMCLSEITLGLMVGIMISYLNRIRHLCNGLQVRASGESKHSPLSVNDKVRLHWDMFLEAMMLSLE